MGRAFVRTVDAIVLLLAIAGGTTRLVVAFGCITAGARAEEDEEEEGRERDTMLGLESLFVEDMDIRLFLLFVFSTLEDDEEEDDDDVVFLSRPV